MRGRFLLFALTIVAGLVAAAGCKSESADPNSAASGGATPPPPTAPTGTTAGSRGGQSQLGAPKIGNPNAVNGGK